eukprot:scaffold3032_cov375-Prasinococcus_capsulatus_cf.AAC.13
MAAAAAAAGARRGGGCGCGCALLLAVWCVQASRGIGAAPGTVLPVAALGTLGIAAAQYAVPPYPDAHLLDEETGAQWEADSATTDERQGDDSASEGTWARGILGTLVSHPPQRRHRRASVCIVSSEFAGIVPNGGIGTFYSTLAETLVLAGHKVGMRAPAAGDVARGRPEARLSLAWRPRLAP